MAISVGDQIPDVKLMTMGEQGPTPVQSHDVLGRGKVVLFSVPGAFTPTCSDYHLPGFVLRADEIKAKGVDTIACIAVNDPFVMGAWGQSQDVGGTVLMLSDGNGEFAAATGTDTDLSVVNLGTRSKRYAMILQDGVVQAIMIEPGPGLEVSSADKVLEAL